MEKFHIDNILKLTELKNEFDLERATALHSKLRLMIKEDPGLSPLRTHLTKLIKSYEDKHWSDEENITDKQVEESDKAELLINFENEFIQKRKESIKACLTKLGLNQQDLAKILGHRKSYMSELMNGVRPFSSSDIMIMHRILKIKLETLMSPILKEEVVSHIRQVVSDMHKPQLKITKEDLEKSLACA